MRVDADTARTGPKSLRRDHPRVHPDLEAETALRSTNTKVGPLWWGDSNEGLGKPPFTSASSSSWGCRLTEA